MRVFAMVAAGIIAAAATATGSAQQGVPSNATGKCGDGTYTSAGNKEGACSGHKGLKIWYSGQTNLTNGVDPVKDTPAPTTGDSLPAGKMPDNATGKCKDGTYTKAGFQKGACSSHGGLIIWYSGQTPTSNGVHPE